MTIKKQTLYDPTMPLRAQDLLESCLSSHSSTWKCIKNRDLRSSEGPVWVSHGKKPSHTHNHTHSPATRKVLVHKKGDNRWRAQVAWTSWRQISTWQGTQAGDCCSRGGLTSRQGTAKSPVHRRSWELLGPCLYGLVCPSQQLVPLPPAFPVVLANSTNNMLLPYELDPLPPLFPAPTQALPTCPWHCLLLLGFTSDVSCMESLLKPSYPWSSPKRDHSLPWAPLYSNNGHTPLSVHFLLLTIPWINLPPLSRLHMYVPPMPPPRIPCLGILQEPLSRSWGALNTRHNPVSCTCQSWTEPAQVSKSSRCCWNVTAGRPRGSP